jgi:hypothetical protein
MKILALAPVAAALAAALAFAAPASASTIRPHLVGCGKTTVRPGTYNPVCNDGAGTVVGLHWSAWSATAQGSGEFLTHTCVPDCARGAVRVYPVALRASSAQHGDYTRLRYTFSRGVPAGFARSWTIDFYAGSWHGKVV